MINKIEIEGRVQGELKCDVENESYWSFNFSAPTGIAYKLKGQDKLYTYIRVIYLGDKFEKLKRDLQMRKQIKIIGKLDSEKYVTQSGKTVYNKVIVAEEIYEMKYNEDTQRFEEFMQLC